MQANTVTVGPESALFDHIVYAEDVNRIAIPELKEPLRVTARTRYHQTEQAATVYPAENGFRQMCIRDKLRTAPTSCSRSRIWKSTAGWALPPGATTTTSRSAPVSYTHLDVYKRQPVPIPNTEVKLTCAEDS